MMAKVLLTALAMTSMAWGHGGQSVTFTSDKGGAGKKLVVTVDHSGTKEISMSELNASTGNDDIYYVSWNTHCQVWLYEHSSFGGKIWRLGWGVKDSGWGNKTSSIKIFCNNDCEWQPWSSWSSCSKTCGTGSTQSRTRDHWVGTYNGSTECPSGAKSESRSCSVEKCPIQKIDCTDFHLPNEAELPNYCTDTVVDIITMANHVTGGEEFNVHFTQGKEEYITRTTSSGFTNEFGWDFSEENSEWNSVSESTEILIKDPEVSAGIDTPVGGGSASHSCFNENSVSCTSSNLMGVGGNDLSSLLGFPGRRRLFLGLGGIMGNLNQAMGNNDPDRCKCEETTTTVTKERGTSYTTTVGRMQNQATTMEETFERGTMKHTSSDFDYTCPPFSDCYFATYSVLSICAIPYWGTCTATRTDGTTSTYEVKRDDTENLYVTKQTLPRTYTFGPNVSEQTTDGNICGVMLAPTIDNTGGMCGDHCACPPANVVSNLPNCDCMMEEYQDCGTEDGLLRNGQQCAMNVRTQVADNEICLQSRPSWRNISNCFGQDVFWVSDYNPTVYDYLERAIKQEATNWVIADVGQTCDATCGTRRCDAAKMSALTSFELFAAAAKQAGYECPEDGGDRPRDYPGAPFVHATQGWCYHFGAKDGSATSEVATCSEQQPDSGTWMRSLCYCHDGPWCNNETALQECKAGNSSKTVNGCTTYAKGMKAGDYRLVMDDDNKVLSGCHGCQIVAHDYGACNLEMCHSLCAEMYAPPSIKSEPYTQACKNGCDEYASLIGAAA